MAVYYSMGEHGRQQEYEQLYREVRYLNSLLPKDLSSAPQLQTKTVWNCDLAGFTNITQDRLRRGELALDDWNTQIGKIYHTFDVLESPHGGAIQYYEGDKGVAVFDNPADAIRGAVQVHNAIQAFPEEQTSDGPVTLAIRQGIATGPVFTAVVGNDYRKIPVIAGKGIARAYQMESQATLGRIVNVDTETYEQTKNEFTFDEKNGTYELAQEPDFNFTEFTYEERPPTVPSYEHAIHELQQQKAELLTYFPPLTRDELQGKRAGRIEKATILFSTLPTVAALVDAFDDPGKLHEVYDAHASTLEQVVETKYKGEIDKFYLGKFMARFRRSVEVDGKLSPKEAAKEAALELAEELAKNEHVQALLAEAGLHYEVPARGYTTGRVYIGPLGSENRRTFTMLGARVNRAARLMVEASSHPEKIVTDSETDAVFVATPHLKGIGKTAIYSPTKRITKHAEKKLVGRDEEIKKLSSLVQEVYDTHESKLVNIVADAGYGKTELTRELERQFTTGDIYKASAAEQAKDIPGYLIQELARNALQIKLGESKEQVKKKLDVIANEEARNIVHHWLGLNLGYAAPSASGKQLEEKRRHALLGLVKNGKPRLLMFNDVHWADENSLDTIEWLAQQLPNALITTNYRPKEISRTISGEHIELGAFDTVGVRQLVEQMISAPDAGLVDFVFKHSHGIPLYVEEIVNYLKEEQLVIAGRLTVPDVEIDIPDSIDELVKARYKNLKDAVKQEVLDYASCMFGEEFPRALLTQALGKDLDDVLISLEEADFLRLKDGMVGFKHNLSKKAVYNSFRPTHRANAHVTIGDSRRELFGEGDDQIDALAYDYGEGDDEEKLVMYNFRAAKKYLKVSHRNSQTSLSYAKKVSVKDLKLDWAEQTKEEYLRALLAEAVALGALKLLPKAEKVFDTLFSKIGVLGDETVKADIHWKGEFNLARLLAGVDRKKEALHHYTTASEAAKPLRDSYADAAILYQSAYLYEEGEEEKRIEQFEAVISKGEQIPLHLRCAAMTGLMLTLAEIGRVTEKAPLFIEAEVLVKKLKSLQDKAVLHQARAFIFANEGKILDAQDEFQKSNESWIEIGMPGKVKEVLNNQFNFYCRLGKLEMAERALEKLQEMGVNDEELEIKEKKLSDLRSSFP